MARADSSPKAIVKAAIRSRCHVIAKRYPHQRLERLHGSNVKWLVLSEELFDEVCSEFTIQKLDMDRSEKRALFDADWVPQVTYELITKPSRPRRRRSQQEIANAAASRTVDTTQHCDMAWEPTNAHAGSRMSVVNTSPTESMYSNRSFPESYDRSSRTRSSIDSSEAEAAAAASVGRHDSVTSSLSSLSGDSTPKPTTIAPSNTPTFSQPRWFETVLN